MADGGEFHVCQTSASEVRVASWLALLTQISYLAPEPPEWFKVVAFIGGLVCVTSLITFIRLWRRHKPPGNLAWSLKPALWGSPIAVVVVGITAMSVSALLMVKLLHISLPK